MFVDGGAFVSKGEDGGSLTVGDFEPVEHFLLLVGDGLSSAGVRFVYPVCVALMDDQKLSFCNLLGFFEGAEARQARRYGKVCRCLAVAASLSRLLKKMVFPHAVGATIKAFPPM